MSQNDLNDTEKTELKVVVVGDGAVRIMFSYTTLSIVKLGSWSISNLKTQKLIMYST